MSEVRGLRSLLFAVLVLLNTAAGAFPADSVVVVLLDDSGSMNQVMANGTRRIEAAKQALASVLSQLPPETQLEYWL